MLPVHSPIYTNAHALWSSPSLSSPSKLTPSKSPPKFTAPSKRLKSIVRSAQRRSPPPPHTTVVIERLDASVPIGLRVLLSGADPISGVEAHSTHGAIVLFVDPFSLAWCAKLRAGDLIESVTYDDGYCQTFRDGEDCTAQLRPARGRLTLCVRPRAWSAEDEAASRLQASWLGGRTRLAMRQLEEEPTPVGRGPIRSPPRLSSVDEED